MLDEAIAQSLLEHFEGATKYNINIMNEAGIIIASTDPSRLGSFHEAAYLMVSKQTPTLDIYQDGDYLGTKHGVNLTIQYRHKTVGVVGITGRPDEVRLPAQLLKASIEGLLEYEYQKQMQRQRTSLMDRFFNQLFWQDDPDPHELNTQAGMLGYHHDATRIPVLIVTDSHPDADEVVSICKKAPLYSGQDILFIVNDNEVLLYLTLPEGLPPTSTYRSIVESYLVTCRGYLEKAKSSYHFYVGSIQNRLNKYHMGFQHCRWLSKHITAGDSAVYFYEYSDDYLRTLIPMNEYRDVFSAYLSTQPRGFWQDFIRIVPTLLQNNGNLIKSSADLHMHRNTLVYRVNKIRSQLGIDLINDARAVTFASQLCYYLTYYDQ